MLRISPTPPPAKWSASLAPRRSTLPNSPLPWTTYARSIGFSLFAFFVERGCAGINDAAVELRSAVCDEGSLRLVEGGNLQLRWETERLIVRRDPQRHHARLAAFFRVRFRRQRRIRADGHIYFHGSTVPRRLRSHNLVALDRAVITRRSPIRHEVAHSVALRWLPQRVCPVRVAHNQGLKKFSCHLLLGVVPEGEIQCRDEGQAQHHARDYPNSRFVTRNWRGIE